jgi:hypothetical protein
MIPTLNPDLRSSQLKQLMVWGKTAEVGSVTIIKCDFRSTEGGFLAGTVEIGRHPSDLDP